MLSMIIMVNVNVEVDGKIHQKLRILCMRRKKSLIKIVNEALKEKVERDS